MALAGILKKIFGSKADRDLKQIRPILDKVLAAYGPIDALSDDELRSSKSSTIHCIGLVDPDFAGAGSIGGLQLTGYIGHNVCFQHDQLTCVTRRKSIFLNGIGAGHKAIEHSNAVGIRGHGADQDSAGIHIELDTGNGLAR